MAPQDEAPDAEGRDRAEQDAVRRRRRTEVFGDVLPDETGDERGDAWGDQERGAPDDATEEWLRRQVPPHHS